MSLNFEVTTPGRGFERIDWDAYLPKDGRLRLVGASSAIGSYNDSFDRPGSSFIWVGEHHHLTRGEADELGRRLQAWAATGSLLLPEEKP